MEKRTQAMGRNLCLCIAEHHLQKIIPLNPRAGRHYKRLLILVLVVLPESLKASQE
jgi:hypothetical protein